LATELFLPDVLILFGPLGPKPLLNQVPGDKFVAEQLADYHGNDLRSVGISAS
jgi:hypothetical protein